MNNFGMIEIGGIISLNFILLFSLLESDRFFHVPNNSANVKERLRFKNDKEQCLYNRYWRKKKGACNRIRD